MTGEEEVWAVTCEAAMATVTVMIAMPLRIIGPSLIEQRDRKRVLKHPFRCYGLLFVAAVLTPFHAGCATARNDAYRQSLIEIQQHIEQNDLAAARTMIDTAGQKYPADAGLENLLGVVEITQGHAAAAVRQFSAAILHDPALTSAYLNLGRIYLEHAQTDKAARASAMRVYEKLLLKQPTNGEANYEAAMLSMWDQRYERSLEYLARLSPEDRGRVGALVVACTDHAALHHQQAADQAADALAAAPDFTEQDAMQLTPVLRRAHRADVIDRLLTAANEKHALSAEGLRLLGLAQEGEGKLDLARKTLELAFAQGTPSVAVLVDLTRVAKAGNDDQGALGYLAHARALDPGNAGFAYEFGVISLRMALLGESRKAMTEAVRLAPDNPEFNYGLGVVSSFAQDSTQGLPYLEKYHALRPADPAALLAIGTTWFRAKNYDSASKWLTQAAGHRSTAPDAHYYLGRIARVTGHLDAAKRELEQANALSPNRPDILGELGQVYIGSHDYAQAQTVLDRAVARDPENYGANFGLLQLYARTQDPRREEQSKRFDEIKAKDEEHYKEMMRTIDLRPEDAP